MNYKINDLIQSHELLLHLVRNYPSLVLDEDEVIEDISGADVIQALSSLSYRQEFIDAARSSLSEEE